MDGLPDACGSVVGNRNGNDTVAASYLFILLGLWSGDRSNSQSGKVLRSTCLSCPADFDCDGDVDSVDRFLLVSRIISPTFPPPGCEGTSSAAAADQAAQEIGFADAQLFVDWLSQASEEQASAASFVFSTLVSQFEGE